MLLRQTKIALKLHMSYLKRSGQQTWDDVNHAVLPVHMKILSLSIDMYIYAHTSVHVCAFHTNLRAAVRQRRSKICQIKALEWRWQKRLPGMGENKGLSNILYPAFSIQWEQEEQKGNESKMSIRKCLCKLVNSP